MKDIRTHEQRRKRGKDMDKALKELKSLNDQGWPAGPNQDYYRRVEMRLKAIETLIEGILDLNLDENYVQDESGNLHRRPPHLP